MTGSAGFGIIGEPLMEIDLEVAVPTELSAVAERARRHVAITGGSVHGKLNGKVLPGGSDWQTVRPDGTLEIDARHILALDEGLVEVESRGLRAGPADILTSLGRGESVDPQAYYFRTVLRFTTSAPELLHLNSILAIACGERRAHSVHLTVYEVA
jgi:Protein of unknown function (DUF3237)